MSTRRQFLETATVAVAAGALPSRAAAHASDFDPQSWSSIRAQFTLADGVANFATFLLASHPQPVRDAIERHRRALDLDAKRYLEDQESVAERRVREAAAAYLAVSADEIALTNNTTMGLGLLYGGLRLRPGQEVLTTVHDFYSTHESLRLRALRTGAHVRKIRLYRNARAASVDEIVTAIRRSVRGHTRVLAITWVHSSTGVKLPVRAIADALRDVNARRDPASRVLLCVDGVHGLGSEAATPTQLGCDFFVSGCHKWLFGPRGTGIVWGRQSAWNAVAPTIPTFDTRAFGPWLHNETPTTIPGLPRAAAMTPGGFHAFEHRWALREAFDFRRQIGRERAALRTHELATRLKAGLREIKGVRVITPSSTALSAGLVCIVVAGRDPSQFVDALYDQARVVATVTPYAQRYVRFGPSILNSPEEVELALRTIRKIV
jgi:selenocysteine lyase/cysteine desulfurase